MPPGASRLERELEHEMAFHRDMAVAYLAAGTGFLIVVSGAAMWPARRALKIDPLRALRCD